MNHPNTVKILDHVLRDSKNDTNTVIPINHYKDVFNRAHQNFELQKKHPNLILAMAEGSTVYPGAPVCQNFGNAHFYYTSCIMNCLYDCEYCYLQGMYPSANLVIFVNLEHVFAEIERLLQEHSVYLCISYDTDLLALESLHGFVHQWADFVRSHEDLTVELRTKSANTVALKDIPACNRFILAWTVSPVFVASNYEHLAPSLSARLSAMKAAMEGGHPVRLCFDPMIPVKDYKVHYAELISEIARTIPIQMVKDASIGTFRVPADYMKVMRKHCPSSAVIQYPYHNDHGVFGLEHTQNEEMISFMKHLLQTYLPEEKLFIWED